MNRLPDELEALPLDGDNPVSPGTVSLDPCCRPNWAGQTLATPLYLVRVEPLENGEKTQKKAGERRRAPAKRVQRGHRDISPRRFCRPAASGLQLLPCRSKNNVHRYARQAERAGLASLTWPREEKVPRRRDVHDTLVNELVDDQGGPAGSGDDDDDAERHAVLLTKLPLFAGLCDTLHRARYETSSKTEYESISRRLTSLGPTRVRRTVMPVHCPPLDNVSFHH
ncbi:hypothetical protein WN48_07766 [Eufriesea mexicana]|uniref:Uncharacterized protein n=1 Tax=Eufriesea mexicana TaxID=516756 RepID=A0A310SC74_9HYME|nr:hypothetical protein WN48_07766 [Eufriesea mexicana]